MDHLTSNNWVSLGGEPITDIRQRIQKRFDDDRFTFHVGTDSKSYRDHTIITTTICFREHEKGALVAYQRNKIKNFNNITGYWPKKVEDLEEIVDKYLFDEKPNYLNLKR